MQRFCKEMPIRHVQGGVRRLVSAHTSAAAASLTKEEHALGPLLVQRTEPFSVEMFKENGARKRTTEPNSVTLIDADEGVLGA